MCSYVIQNLTWEFGFWFVSIALGIATVMVFLFVPEVISVAYPGRLLSDVWFRLDDVPPGQGN